ncbi:MAG TPA: lanthionine synthetase LanC family protein, partial [Actinopolymorphaceae bacterium]|nr:lanthionine synthetase LanC family protein [Actinopolymorphaceae bacterium]
RSTAGQTSYVSLDQALVTARQLVAVVAGVHAAGVVLRDLSPTNIVVAPNGSLSLIDLNAAATGGQLATTHGRTTYQAPECRGGSEPMTAQFTEDYWSLGALLFLLVTGNDPVLPDDEPTERAVRDRVAAWLSGVAAENPAAGVLTQPILGLLAEAPDRRWSLARVEKYLALHADRAASGGRVGAGPDRLDMSSGRVFVRGPVAPVLPAPTTERLLADGLDHLLATMADRPEADRLWPTTGFGARTDAGNLQHGAAGILGVLMQALEQAPEPDHVRLLAAVRRGASWLAAHQPARDPARPLPGLYFGQAGTAWALADAGLALQDVRLVEQAVDLLLALPTRWPNPDIAHGLAGAGLAHLYVARNVPDSRLLDRVLEYADAIVAAAEEGIAGPVWPIPADAPSRLAGACHYGFAHGVAGVAYFLLAAGTETGRESYVKVALEAGRTLCRLATTDPQGAAWWPVGPDDRTPLPHWCSGSSGIGTFLLRLYAATDEPAIGAYAGAAAVAAHRARWQSLPSSCHGLAGNGQFLLDAAHLLDDATYADWADDLVEAMAVRHCRRAGRLLIPDETGHTVTPDYQTGLAGVLSFLLRLQHGGPRPWMADDLLDVTTSPDPEPISDP